jgi:predicted Zn finger-like uncharacterized protein
MSLATQCPHCHTTFKVAHDQLKLQAGLVRCGICKQIFNGIEYLVEIADPPQEIATPSSQPEEPKEQPLASAPKDEITLLPFIDMDGIEEIIIPQSGLDDAAFEREILAEQTERQTKSDKHTKSAQPDQSPRIAEQKPEAEPESQGARTETRRPTRYFSNRTATFEADTPPLKNKKNQETTKSDEAAKNENVLEQPSFIKQANAKNRFARLLKPSVVILLILLFGQTTYLLRNYIAAIYPPAREDLTALCQLAHCQIHHLTQLDAIKYEAAELHTLPRANTYELGLIMRNQSMLTQAWPHIVLTLQNAQKQPLLKRVFSPADYLTPQDKINRGFLAHKDYVVRLYFEVNKIQATDFVTEIFYP